MNIQEIFDFGVKLGIEADPRGKTGVDRWLKLEKKKFDKLNDKEKKEFDRDRLTNPYADSAVLYDDDSKREIKRVVAGIDMEVGEIALVKTLTVNRQPSTEKYEYSFLQSVNGKRSTVNNQFPQEIDLIITHHPQGKALAALDEVMNMQADMMASFGVPINIAEGVMRERISKVRRGVSPENHMRSIDAAKLAGFSMLNMHTPCDNLVYQFLTDLMTKKKPETVGEVVEALKEVPEYQIAGQNGAGPMIFAGTAENRAGRIVASDITGGTSGAKEVYPALARAGVGTIIGMHINEESREEAAKNHLNVVIAGHISSDSLGMNLYLDQLAKAGVEIIPLSGLIRVER